MAFVHACSVDEPVPGDGPIQSTHIENGVVFATRSDVEYIATTDGWKQR